jgi:hypothetical protein
VLLRLGEGKALNAHAVGADLFGHAARSRRSSRMRSRELMVRER